MTSPTLAPSCANLDLGAYDTTRAAVAADSAAGRGSFTAVTTWTDGARARTVARSFAVETDEPAPLGGTDRAVDPMELLLAALGTCLTIGWVTGAAKRGLDFRSLVIRVEGDYDLAGYLAPRRRGSGPASRRSATRSRSTPTPSPRRSRRSGGRPRQPRRCSTTSPDRRRSRPG